MSPGSEPTAGQAGAVESAWGTLYKIGGASALILAVILPFQIALYFIRPPNDGGIFAVRSKTCPRSS